MQPHTHTHTSHIITIIIVEQKNNLSVRTIIIIIVSVCWLVCCKCKWEHREYRNIIKAFYASWMCVTFRVNVIVTTSQRYATLSITHFVNRLHTRNWLPCVRVHSNTYNFRSFVNGPAVLRWFSRHSSSRRWPGGIWFYSIVSFWAQINCMRSLAESNWNYCRPFGQNENGIQYENGEAHNVLWPLFLDFWRRWRQKPKHNNKMMEIVQIKRSVRTIS